MFAAMTACLSLLGLELGRRLGAAFVSGADHLAGIVLMVAGLIVAVGYPQELLLPERPAWWLVVTDAADGTMASTSLG